MSGFEELDLSVVPARILLRTLGGKFLRRARRLVTADRRFVWTPGEVSNSLVPEADIRNYYEHRNIRTMLGKHLKGRVHRACEVGCGYGRVLPVLTEFADAVVGIEREPRLAAIARRSLHGVEIVDVGALEDLGRLGAFDLVLTCTVLQHLVDQEAERVIGVIKAAAPKGLVLLVEKLGPSMGAIGNPTGDGTAFLSRTRTLELYQSWLAPFHLVDTADRLLEATSREPVARLMLFASPECDLL